MKKLLILLLLLLLSCSVAFADSVTPVASTPPAPQLGFGPGVIATTSAFYFNGKYKLLQGSPMVGAVYTFKQSGNVNSAGFFVGPSIVNENGITTTTINTLLHISLFQTKVGSWGAGIGTEFWTSNVGVKPTASKSFFTLDYGFN